MKARVRPAPLVGLLRVGGVVRALRAARGLGVVGALGVVGGASLLSCFVDSDGPAGGTASATGSGGSAAGSGGGATGPGGGATGTGSDCPEGTPGCPCLVGASCDAGSQCLSNVCVEQTEADESGGTETGPATTCGNRTVDPDEECDSSLGCSECELIDYTCNPYNQVGCADTQTCDRTRRDNLDGQRTGCFQQGQASYAEDCTYNPLDPALQCGDALSCVDGAFVPGCEGQAGCCTEFCLIGGESCPDPASQCLTWKEVGMPPGLDELGLCIRLRGG